MHRVLQGHASDSSYLKVPIKAVGLSSATGLLPLHQVAGNQPTVGGLLRLFGRRRIERRYQEAVIKQSQKRVRPTMLEIAGACSAWVVSRPPFETEDLTRPTTWQSALASIVPDYGNAIG